MDIKSLIKKGPTTRPPKIMLIGVEGVGKSTAGANMPNPVFMCSESGLVGPQFNDVPNFTPKSWKEALEFIDALATDPGDFKTLVVDTLDWLEPMLYDYVVAAAKKPDAPPWQTHVPTWPAARHPVRQPVPGRLLSHR